MLNEGIGKESGKSLAPFQPGEPIHHENFQHTL